MTASVTLVGAVQYVLSAAPAPNPLQLWNTGGGPIYFSSTPGVSPTSNEGSVSVNGNTSKPSGVTLYLCTDIGATATFVWSADGTSYNPGTVTNQSANAPTVITTLNVPYAASLNAPIVDYLAGIDISSYSSLIFVVNVNSATAFSALGAGTVGNPYQIIDLVIGQSANGGSPDTGQPASMPLASADAVITHAQWLLTSFGAAFSTIAAQSMQVPVRRGKLGLSLFIGNGSAAAPVAGSVTLTIYGSSEVITAPRYISQGNGFGGNIPDSGYYTITGAGINHSDLISSINGPANYLLSNQAGGGGTGGIEIISNGVPTFILFAPAPAVGSVTVENIEFPLRPIIAVSNSASGGTYITTILQ